MLRVPHLVYDLYPLVPPDAFEGAVPQYASPLAPVPALEVRGPVLALDDERGFDGEGAQEAEVDKGRDGDVDRGRVGGPGVVEEGEEVRCAAFRDGPAVEAFRGGGLVEEGVEVLGFYPGKGRG